jgi:hypothetical protein
VGARKENPAVPTHPSPHHPHDPTPRERLRTARADLHPSSPWRELLTTALQAVDETGQGRHRALCWLHHALTVRLPENPSRDSLEQRALRRAADAIEDELDSDDALLRAA